MTIPRTIPGAVCAAIRAEATLPVWQPGKREYERGLALAIYLGMPVADWPDLTERKREVWERLEGGDCGVRIAALFVAIRRFRGPPE